MKTETPMFKKGVPGNAWWEGLKNVIQSYPPESLKSLIQTEPAHWTLQLRQAFFEYLGSLLDELNLKNSPENIWNADETGLRFEHDPVRVISEKGIKNVVGKTSENEINISIMTCGNAAGRAMPPLVIVKGKT